jgi:hypothetical protein
MEDTFMITDDQRLEFERTGLLRLPGAVEADSAAGMVDRIWDHLAAKHSVDRDRPDSWTIRAPHGLRPVTAAREFQALGSPTVRAAAEDLLGAGRWTPPRRWGRLLITFPDPAVRAWTVPHGGWHNDFWPVRDHSDSRAVQLFVILNDLEAGGGGTLVLTGSHRLVRRYLDRSDVGPHPKRLRRLLGADPWLRELWHPDGSASAEGRICRFMIDGGTVGDVPLRVVELTGRAGDVYLMHCDTFHCAAPNVSDRPRMMATGTLARD